MGVFLQAPDLDRACGAEGTFDGRKLVVPESRGLPDLAGNLVLDRLHEEVKLLPARPGPEELSGGLGEGLLLGFGGTCGPAVHLAGNGVLIARQVTYPSFRVMSAFQR